MSRPSGCIHVLSTQLSIAERGFVQVKYAIIGSGKIAGAGVIHNEQVSPEFMKSGGVLELSQLWINLPLAFEDDCASLYRRGSFAAGQAFELHTPPLKLADEIDQMLDPSSEPVQFANHKDVPSRRLS